MFTLEQLQETHQSYKDVAKAANFYYASYIGGETYKAGSYLTKYIGEESAPGDQYGKRLASTPLDNHVQTTVDIYRSFLFRTLPKRELGNLTNNPLVHEWLTDTDQEGQGMDSFLKTANDLSMITGACWILVDKASYKVETQAQEAELGIRAYAATYSPQNVLDWYYERNIAGKPILHYIKVKESENTDYVNYTCWYTDKVCKYKASKDDQGRADKIVDYQEYENPLGEVPFVFHAPIRSPVRGVGVSLVADVSNQQKFIYNCLSEIEQHLRISSHPTLVKTASTDANAGAGGVVQIQDDMDPGHKPYLLQPSLSTTDSILKTIENSVNSIKRMTHTSAIQASTGSPMSGVALQTERQLLNAKLSDMSDTLRETELAMWELWLKWQALDMNDDFHIEYSESFDMRDEHLELDFLLKARSSGVNIPEYQQELDRQIIALTVDDSEIQSEILQKMDSDFTPHIMVSPTGEAVNVNSEQQHNELAALGYTHVDGV